MMKICMIVDDSPVIRKVARRIMELLGYIVVEAGNGEEAMRLCFDSRPDLILVDWNMPSMSGIEFISAFREMQNSASMEGDQEQNVSTKIIYCTSELMVAEMTKAKRAGADGFLMKPFSKELVETRLVELGLASPVSAAA